MFEPVQPVRAYQRIVEQVEGAIVRGELRAGQHLPSERELMRSFAVSRSTVREALRVLQSNGIIRSRPGDPAGPEVLPVGPEVLRAPLVRLASTDRVGLVELLQFRLLLETTACPLAASLRSAADLERIRAALSDVAAAVAVGPAEWVRADTVLHDRISAATGNVLLTMCAEAVRSVSAAGLASAMSDAPDPVEPMRDRLAADTRLFEAIAAGDATAAAALAETELITFYAACLPASERDELARWADRGGVDGGSRASDGFLASVGLTRGPRPPS